MMRAILNNEGMFTPLENSFLTESAQTARPVRNGISNGVKERSSLTGFTGLSLGGFNPAYWPMGHIVCKNLASEILPLACFVFYIYFSFCDGFSLKPRRKIIWAVYFLMFSYLSFLAKGYYDLYFIIPLSSLLAFILAWFQKKENKLKGK